LNIIQEEKVGKYSPQLHMIDSMLIEVEENKFENYRSTAQKENLNLDQEKNYIKGCQGISNQRLNNCLNSLKKDFSSLPLMHVQKETLKYRSQLMNVSTSTRDTLSKKTFYSDFEDNKKNENILNAQKHNNNEKNSASIFKTSYYMCVRPDLKKRQNTDKLDTSFFYHFSKRSSYTYFNNKKLNCPSLINEMYPNLLKQEMKTSKAIRPDYFSFIQSDINEKMRAVLLDWIIDVHLKFKLQSETLFLTVSLLDRYLSIKYIESNRLQLLGVTCFWIACKYEEITVPLLKDCEYITDNAYTQLEIKLMEKEVLATLNYEICFPTSISFYDILAVNFNFQEIHYHLGRYLLELFLLDARSNKYKASTVACAIIYLTMKLNKENFPEYALIKEFLTDEEKLMKECAKEVCYLLSHSDNQIFATVKNKYAMSEFFNVSNSSVISQVMKKE
jgi:G2/mitotic-specific cyclin-B, other